MVPQKRLVLSVDHDQITLPKELIPDHVTMFGYELQRDGRIILTPLSTTGDDPLDYSEGREAVKDEDGLAKVIDFKAARLYHEKQTEKNKQTKTSLKADEALGGKSEFVMLHHFSSRMEAEMLGEILNQSEIPYLIQSEDIGIFGPGAAPVPGGAQITVRKSDLEFARKLLSGLI